MLAITPFLVVVICIGVWNGIYKVYDWRKEKKNRVPIRNNDSISRDLNEDEGIIEDTNQEIS